MSQNTHYLSPRHTPSSELPDDVVLRVDNISKKFCRNLKRSMVYGMKDLACNLVGVKEDTTDLRRDEFWALKNISFELKKGECLGLVGGNGSGKTTLLRIITGVFPPDSGVVSFRGRVGALIALGAGFHPNLTGRENIFLNGSILGLSKEEVTDSFESIVAFSEIGDFLDAPVSTYSSGMKVRLGFAVATAMKPDLLLVDEVLAVGDIAFRSKCFQRIGEVMHDAAVIFVSHDASQISRICDKCMYLESGVQRALDFPDKILSQYEKDAPLYTAEPHIICDNNITFFDLTLGSSLIKWGDFLDLSVNIKMSRERSMGLVLLSFNQAEQSVAQVDITAAVNTAQQSKGLDFCIKIGPVSLREGSYNLVLTALDEGCKKTVLHAINWKSLRVEGDRGYGVPYQLGYSVVV